MHKYKDLKQSEAERLDNRKKYYDKAYNDFLSLYKLVDPLTLAKICKNESVESVFTDEKKATEILTKILPLVSDKEEDDERFCYRGIFRDYSFQDFPVLMVEYCYTLGEEEMVIMIFNFLERLMLMSAGTGIRLLRGIKGPKMFELLEKHKEKEGKGLKECLLHKFCRNSLEEVKLLLEVSTCVWESLPLKEQECLEELDNKLKEIGKKGLEVFDGLLVKEKENKGEKRAMKEMEDNGFK